MAIKNNFIVCAVAGCTARATQVDHIIPLSKGGVESMANLRPVCTHHNASKGNRTND